MQDMRTTMIQTEQKREAAMLKFFGDMEKLAMDRAQMVADTEIAAREAAKQTRESVQ
jgi:hypothetical protein